MSIQLKVFQLSTAVRSYLTPQAVAIQARTLMTTPRVTPAMRAIDNAWVDETIALGEEAYLSVRHGGPLRVLVMHGWNSGLPAFHKMLEAFDRARFSLYFVHAPGHGPSHALVSHPARFIAALEQAIAHIDQPIDVAIGHSMGAGAVNFVQARSQPFKRMVLISGPARMANVLNRFARFLRLGAKAHQAFLEQMVSTTGIALQSLDFVQFAPGILAPVLVIHDRYDREIPYDEGVALYHALPSARLFTTHRLGHRKLLQDEALIDEIVAFASAKGSRHDAPSSQSRLHAPCTVAS